MAQEIADSTLLDTWGSGGNIVEPDISKIIEGWQLGEQPPHEYMNWLQNTFGSKLNHILKNGVASWNNETEYLAGATVQHNGNIWLCKTTNTNSEPTDANANWKRIITKDYVDSIALPIGTILNGYTIFDNCIVAFGGEFNRADYPKLWDYLQANPSLVKTQAEWTAESTANDGICGFYSDGNGTTTFRVPNLDKAFLRPDNRGVGSFQKGTLVAWDITADGAGIQAINDNNSSPTLNMSRVNIGADSYILTQYPNLQIAGVAGSLSPLPGSNTYASGITRPKNIAVLPLIVAK